MSDLTQAKRSENAVAKILGQKLGYGSIIKAELFEEALGVKRNDQAYGFLISRIRRELYNHGLYLDGEGFAETGCYQILEPADNQWIARLAIARAERDLEGKMILLANTETQSLSELQRRRHESVLREVSIKLDAMRRARDFEKKLKYGRKTEPIDVEPISEAKPNEGE